MFTVTNIIPLCMFTVTNIIALVTVYIAIIAKQRINIIYSTVTYRRGPTLRVESSTLISKFVGSRLTGDDSFLSV